MSDEEIDPEVLADLQLRATSMHDSTRTRGRDTYSWSAPAIVAYWPCRAGGTCRGSVAGQPAVVGVTAEAIDARETFNRQLRSKGEAEIPTHAIAFCETCKRAGLSMQAIVNQDRRERMAAKIRRLKESPPAHEEREIVDQLRKWSHPDVDGLLQSLREKRDNGKTPRKGI